MWLSRQGSHRLFAALSRPMLFKAHPRVSERNLCLCNDEDDNVVIIVLVIVIDIIITIIINDRFRWHGTSLNTCNNDLYEVSSLSVRPAPFFRYP